MADIPFSTTRLRKVSHSSQAKMCIWYVNIDFSFVLTSLLAKQAFETEKRTLADLKRKAERDAPLAEYEAKFAREDIPNTIDEIDRLIMETDARIKGVVSDPGAIQRHQEVKSTRETVERNLRKAREEKASKLENLERLKSDWLGGLQDSVSKIDRAFSVLFQKMGCSASVHLSEHADFAMYGLEIKVQFRKEDPPQVLSRETHSGGERSVSTMLYLLALQSVTQVPFRCVDEINQGMDPRNERMIFDRIVEQSASGANNPQYFLVTPKLLPNLNYTAAPNISVLFVFNGWFMLDGNSKCLYFV
jgi:chromosome segregation ATPase